MNNTPIDRYAAIKAEKKRRKEQLRQKPEPKSGLGFFVARETSATYHPLSRSGYGYDVRTGIYDRERGVVPFEPEENGKWLQNTKQSRERQLPPLSEDTCRRLGIG